MELEYSQLVMSYVDPFFRYRSSSASDVSTGSDCEDGGVSMHGSQSIISSKIRFQTNTFKYTSNYFTNYIFSKDIEFKK